MNRRTHNKGKDVVHPLKVSLEDMYNGTTKRLSLQKNVICSKCKGRGGKEGAVSRCGSCRGTGIQVKVHHIGPGMMQQVCYALCLFIKSIQYLAVLHFLYEPRNLELRLAVSKFSQIFSLIYS